MKNLIRGTTLLLALIAATGPGFVMAQDLMVYPAQGQNAAQQQTDEGECYTWSKQNTGIDPMAAAPQQQQSGGMARGALRGAAVGAIIDGSDGAKKGAGVGAAVGGIRRADQNRNQANQQQANHQTFNRAYSACMQGRGYSVQ